MTRRITKAAAALLLVFLATRAPAAVDMHDRSWFVHGTPIRFKVRLATPPTHDRAGYIVTLPDGGLLPGPITETTVVDHKGHMIRHGCLWHDPGRGLALVFEKPRGQIVYIHAARGEKHVRWFPESGLTPSVLALTKHGGTDVRQARFMGTHIPQGEGIFFTRLDRLAVGSIPEGLSGTFSDHVLGYVAPPRAGVTWVSATSIAGARTDIAIDGAALELEPARPRRRDQGRRVRLDESLHRIDMFSHRPTESARSELVWKLPKTRKADTVRAEDTVKSGTAVIEEIRFRDDSPVPAFSIAPTRILRVSKSPVMLYEFEARTSDNPPDALYTWSFSQGRSIPNRKRVMWLFEQGEKCEVSLAVSIKGRTNHCSYTFTAFGPDSLTGNLRDAETRAQFEQVLLAMLRSAPSGADPTVGWPATFRDLLDRIVEPGRADELVAHLFRERWEVFAQKLSREDRWRFEDVFFFMLCRTDPEEAGKRCERFMKEAKDAERRQHWKLRRAELLMYYMDDLDGASRFARSVTPAGSPAHRRAQVRLGDIALLRGDLAQAKRLYEKVQNAVQYESWKSRADRHPPPGVAARPQPTVPDDHAQPPPKEARPKP
ncbi:MAG: hypothetical protein HQ559_10765, partial [Lentisphaerae bacterium]|nr:hypothetical protein [Lentisphaerota bacterium]